jgi:putative heme-binding domain-containing protein
LLAAAQDDSAAFRQLAVRLLAARAPEALYQADWLVDDPNPMVRRQILVELRDFPDSTTRDQWMVRLALQYDGRDRFYREAIGIAFKGREAWGYEQLRAAMNGRWDERLAGLALQLHPPEALALAKEALANEMLGSTPRKAALDVVDAIGTAEAGKVLVGQVVDPLSTDLYAHALQHLARNAGQDWQSATEGKAFDEALAAGISDPERGKAAWAYVAETGRESLAPLLVSKALDIDEPTAKRLQALDGLAAIAPKVAPEKANGLVEQIALLFRGDDEQFHAPTIKAIQAFRGTASHDILLGLTKDGDQPKPLRVAVARQLASTQSGALGLLGLVEAGELPGDLTRDVSELTHASPFEDVQMMAQQLLPTEQTADGQALPGIADLVAMSGDPQHGKEVFFGENYAQCSRCHQVGDEGKEVGPDLTVIGQKFGREGLLESILFPNAAISHEYEVWILETEWEGLLSGFIVSEDDKQVQLMDASGDVKPIKKEEIVERRKSKTSLMPTGLAAAMSAQDLSDLVAYLATLK